MAGMNKEKRLLSCLSSPPGVFPSEWETRSGEGKKKWSNVSMSHGQKLRWELSFLTATTCLIIDIIIGADTYMSCASNILNKFRIKIYLDCAAYHHILFIHSIIHIWHMGINVEYYTRWFLCDIYYLYIFFYWNIYGTAFWLDPVIYYFATFYVKILTIFICALFERGYSEYSAISPFRLFGLFTVHSYSWFSVGFLLLIGQNISLLVQKLSCLLENTYYFMQQSRFVSKTQISIKLVTNWETKLEAPNWPINFHAYFIAP